LLLGFVALAARQELERIARASGDLHEHHGIPLSCLDLADEDPELAAALLKVGRRWMTSGGDLPTPFCRQSSYCAFVPPLPHQHACMHLRRCDDVACPTSRHAPHCGQSRVPARSTLGSGSARWRTCCFSTGWTQSRWPQWRRQRPRQAPMALPRVRGWPCVCQEEPGPARRTLSHTTDWDRALHS
jgi:hypothetical protein